MARDERDALLDNLRLYLSANLEPETPVGQLVNEKG